MYENTRRPAGIFGVPMDLGQDRRGVDMGPSAIRYARLQSALEELGYPVIDLGNAATPMTQRMQRGVKQADGEMKVEPTMDVQNVAQAVLFMDSLSLDANVLTMTIKASAMPFEGRG